MQVTYVDERTRHDRQLPVTLLFPGDRAARDAADPAASRFAPPFEALADAGVAALPAVHHDDFAPEVETQLPDVRAVLVWHDPIEGGRTRRVLDAQLQRVAAQGVFVSAQPDTVLRLGTKDVLADVRDLPFGCDAHRVAGVARLRAEMPARLAQGPRVLKQHRGHSGIGASRVERLDAGRYALRHAMRGAEPDEGPLACFIERLAPYLAAPNGGIVAVVRAVLSGQMPGLGREAWVAASAWTRCAAPRFRSTSI